MRITDFDVYRDLLKEKCGLDLMPDQSYLLDSRLVPVAKKWGYSSVEIMTAILHGVPDRNLVYDVIEAMAVKETNFFRDAWPFRSFTDQILPYMTASKGRQKKIRIWCAGAATGQEPYSVALALKEKAGLLSGWKIEILATDISNEALEQSKLGIYSQHEVQRGLPIRTLLKYFKETGENWQINADIRKMVKHQNFNLLDNMAALGKFDVILCRNVLGSFDGQVRRKTLEKFSGQLEKDGFLILGKTEIMDSEVFAPLHQKRGLYVPAGSPHLNGAWPQGLAKTTV